MIRVALVDDQALIRKAFALMLSVEEDIELVGEAGDGQAAITLAEAARPDVILMDIQMPRMDGLAATRRVRDNGYGYVIVLTTFDRDDYLFEALEAGASGFLLKNCEPERLLEAIRTVADGGALLAPSSYFMKSPPEQYHDDIAHNKVEEFIAQNRIGVNATSASAPSEDAAES